MSYKYVFWKIKQTTIEISKVVLPILQTATVIILIFTLIKMNDQVEQSIENNTIQRDYNRRFLRPYVSVALPNNFRPRLENDGTIKIVAEILNSGISPALNLKIVYQISSSDQLPESILLPELPLASPHAILCASDCIMNDYYETVDSLSFPIPSVTILMRQFSYL